MESIYLKSVKKIYESEFKLFTIKTLQQLLDIRTERNFYQVLQSLQEHQILEKLERSKYRRLGIAISDFELANFLYDFSYVSLESALNYWGILSQFPFEISSVSNKKTNKKMVDGKSFTYSKITPSLYGMFIKENNFLIAMPEKALIDQLYFASRGWRSSSFDEYDLESVNKESLLGLCQELRISNEVYLLIEELPW